MTENHFIGNVGSVELKWTPQGKAVCEISFAENHSKKVNNEWQDDGTTWRRASIWEEKAEATAEHIQKGDRVVVIGRERLREYEAKDGTKGKSLEVQATTIAKVPPLPNRNQSGGGNQGGFSGQPSTPPNQGWGGNSDPWQGATSIQQDGWGSGPDPAF